VDSTIVHITDQEVRFLNEKFSKQSVKRIGQLKPELKNKLTKKHERFKTASITMPVTFRKGTMAILYITGTYGGEFKLMKKKNSNWEFFCSSLVWIE
jgi:hypothetical protein